ncbi:MAG TPA: aromatic ring-hydroxylating dioxygenase subunit alpha [Steroidobacteraceae bacterium]|nr:aromatic ring-hydroxylating dioxygenase subunit alpha [Steroidobacteraceae bacterium]
MATEEQGVNAAEMKAALEPRFYLSDELFRVEVERLFHGQWFCVGREADLAERGDMLHVSVAGEKIIVVRGKDDALRAFYNVCRHRGSRLTWTPTLPDPAQPDAKRSAHLAGGAIVCPYHAWSYNLDGSLRAAPHIRFDDSCPKSSFSLVPVKLDTWGGFIFVHVGDSPSRTLAEQLGVVPERIRRYPLRDMRVGHQIVYEVKANWKILVENYNECYHCGPAHPELCVLVPAFRDHGGAGLTWDDGIPHRPGAWTFTESGTSTRAPFPGLSESEKTHHKGEVAFPNLLMSFAAEHVAAFTLWPTAPDHTRIACDFLFHVSESEKPGFDPSDVVEFWDLVNKQDWGICESVQSGMSSRGFRGAFYAPMEDPSLDIRRYLEMHLGDVPGVRA